MGGGLMQLVAYGAQDIYLTGNPQITFFKVVYRRHTNFAVESIEQTHNGSVGTGSKISVTVSRNGDLLSQVWLSMTAAGGGVAGMETVESIIDNVECEVGGQVIDKQYGHWMKVYTDLTHDADKAALLDSCVAAAAGETSHVPLQFWFCRNPGLALPLIALQYHEVKLNITFNDVTTIDNNSVQLWCDYVFLDTDERRRFAQVSHEYLIEQVQYSNKLNVSGTNPQNELRFNHPVKELVWTVSESGASGGVDIAAVGATGSSTVLDATVTGAGDVNVLEATDLTVKDALLQLNGHDRFKRREGKYFTKVQRYQHHSGSGDRDHRDAVAVATPVGSQSDGTVVPATAAAKANASIPHVYSFALKPEEHQPSGTCNFSRIDNAVLNLTLDAAPAGSGSLRVYAINYNVLRIMSGMGGLAYSN